MTQVNLLPGDVRERQQTRRLTAGLVVAVGAVLALLFFVFMLQVARLSDADQQLAAQEEVNGGLRQQIGELQEFQVLKQEVAAREKLLQEAMAGQVLWSGVLGDVSKIIPGQMWLTGMTGTLAPPPAPVAEGGVPVAPSTEPSTNLVGTIQFSGKALTYPTIARWLGRLQQVTGWVNPWLTTAAKPEEVGGVPVDLGIDFAGTLDITAEAVVGGSTR